MKGLMSYPAAIIQSMTEREPWVCRCRRCEGVLSAADAVQYVWEFALGSCVVPVVVGVDARADGWVTCAWVYWHDEPDEPHPISELGEFMVSCRPGSRTTPTEADIARWTSWASTLHPPRDWLLVDGRRYRSVRDVADALRQRAAMPEERLIPGDWFRDPLDVTWRETIRAQWAETKLRNRAQSTL